MTGRSHDGLVVIYRKDIKDNFCHCRIGGTEQRLGVAGAILEFKPDQRWPLDLIQGFGNLRCKRSR